jgi:tetratricopeptide (TPR) repeat protein
LPPSANAWYFAQIAFEGPSTVTKTRAVSKPARVQAPDRRHQQAILLFERAVRAFGRRDLDRARELFDAVLEQHPEEPELVERARSYRAMCRRPRASRPRTFEELLNYGVLLHNRGEHVLAVKYLAQALELQPSDEGALYCLAAAQARAGDAAAALRALRAAIDANPATRSQARHDADFAPLRRRGEFLSLVAPGLS